MTQPYSPTVRTHADLIDQQMPTPTRVAFLYARPGGRRRARSRPGAFVPTWPVHLADDLRLRVLAPDDVAHPA